MSSLDAACGIEDKRSSKTFDHVVLYRGYALSHFGEVGQQREDCGSDTLDSVAPHRGYKATRTKNFRLQFHLCKI